MGEYIPPTNKRCKATYIADRCTNRGHAQNSIFPQYKKQCKRHISETKPMANNQTPAEKIKIREIYAPGAISRLIFNFPDGGRTRAR